MAVNNIPTSVPSAMAGVPIADKGGNITTGWYQLIVALWNRTGQAPTSVKQVLIAASNLLPAWGFLDGASFNNQNPNAVFAGPAMGPPAAPSFRALATADLASLDGQYPGSTDGFLATIGNIGEVISSQVPGLALASGVVTDVTSIALTTGDWDVWANIGFTGSTSAIKAWISTTSATDPGQPNQGAYLQIPAGQGANAMFPVGMITLQLQQPATVYLTAQVTGTPAASGFLVARRRR